MTMRVLATILLAALLWVWAFILAFLLVIGSFK